MPPFSWPQSCGAAISLSFDDARFSQLDTGLPLLASLGARATFYVTPGMVEKRAEEWRLAAQTHEIGNHTVRHPCSGSFLWSRGNALEEYTLEQLERELAAANDAIREMTGAIAQTFAYPCGQMFVGRGEQTRSFVPLVARRFLAGRAGLGGSPNDPIYCDLAKLSAASFDTVSFEDLQPVLEDTLKTAGWLILVGHDIGDDLPRQAVRPATIASVCAFARRHGIWQDTVEAVARHVSGHR